MLDLWFDFWDWAGASPLPPFNATGGNAGAYDATAASSTSVTVTSGTSSVFDATGGTA